ncbi:hypothetical protein PFFVO_02676 [Plasmodium falciparum Vietnam Oak-Knoll (FVO)]|uniref:Uncharacterized protein n=1 Tax=Plasmodium falciparum Vietnam Oak-Knoll (FVO) TaxID=1036723 RepID=A0A024V7K0_PLAFA|nr:hypothetical protein PFFVO_02676 [Plasmodium falciparum Vietnam Oak-Knoll (FVO)]
MNIIIAVESLTGIFPFEQNHTHKFSYAKDKFFSIYYYDSLIKIVKRFNQNNNST